MYKDLGHWTVLPDGEEITLPKLTTREARLKKIFAVSDAVLDRMEEHAELGDTELLCDLSHAYWNLVDALNRLGGY